MGGTYTKSYYDSNSMVTATAQMTLTDATVTPDSSGQITIKRPVYKGLGNWSTSVYSSTQWYGYWETSVKDSSGTVLFDTYSQSTGYGTRNTYKTLDAGSSTFTTYASYLFNSNNSTSKTTTISGYGYLDVTLKNDAVSSTLSTVLFGTQTITLNAPPTVTVSTQTYSTPQYAGYGTYSVTISKASAQYGGKITSMVLTVGSDTATASYSAASVTNQTLSLVPSVAGTYTPTLKVTDSRGQTTSVSLNAITVNPYLVPSVTFDVERTTSAGVHDDEGHYGLIEATISYTDALTTLTEPTVKLSGVDITSISSVASVAGYTTWDSTNGVSDAISSWASLTPVNSAVTVYGLIDWSFSTTGNFDEGTSYLISVIGNDALGGVSEEITQTLPTAFYTIDFQAGGKEIAFGGPANDSLTNHPNGLFKSCMDAILEADTCLGLDVNSSASSSTQATSGDDMDLFNAILDLGWYQYVIT